MLRMMHEEHQQTFRALQTEQQHFKAQMLAEQQLILSKLDNLQSSQAQELWA